MPPNVPQPPVTAEEAVRTPEWNRLARYAAGLVLILGAALALRIVWLVADVIVVGVLLSIVTGAIARALVRRTGMRHMVAILTVYAVIIAALVLLAITVFPWIARSFEVLLAALKASYPNLGTILSGGDTSGTVPPAAATSSIFSTAQIQRAIEVMAGWVIQLLGAIFRGLAGAVYLGAIGLFLSFLIHVDVGAAGLRLPQGLPGGYKREIRILARRLSPLWLRYLGAQLIFGAVLAVGSIVEYTLLGVPYPILMAVLTGIISLIPSVGGLLASLIVAVPCLIFGSTKFTDMSPLTFTVIVTVINILITQVSYNFILLPILGKAVRLPISIVLIAVLSGFAMNSILFAFLVVPVLASFRILIEYIVAKIRRLEPFPDEPMIPAPGKPGSAEAFQPTAT